MSPTEVRFRRKDVWQGLVFCLVLFVSLYFVLDLPFLVWVVAAAMIFVLVNNVLRAHSPEPMIVINDEGVFDERLRVGVIRWEDIRRIKSICLNRGLYFISLELHNRKTYESRRPLWLKPWSLAKRLYGLGAITICTASLDIGHDTLVEKLHEGCMAAAPGPPTIKIK